MAHRELQVTVISAQGLRNVRLSGRAMSPYAEVRIRGAAAAKVRTRVDGGGGAHPSWNEVVQLPCEEALFRGGGAVTIVLRHRGSFCDKLIGTVTVPLSDLSLQCSAADANASRESTLMSYQVRMRSGKPRGVLNIAVMVGSLLKQPGSSVVYPSETAPPSYPASSAAYNQAAIPTVSQSFQTSPQYYLPPQNGFLLQQRLYPPQFAQPARYSYQQAAY